jgi:AraC family transcriptional regulator
MTPLRKDLDRSGLFGARLGAHLGMSARPLLHARRNERLSLAVTHMQSSLQERELTSPIEPEGAFSIAYRVREVEHHDVYINGRFRMGSALVAGSVNAVDLSENHQSRIRGPFDAVQFYMQKQALDDLAYDLGKPAVSTLATPFNEPDPILGGIVSMLRMAPPNLETTNRLFADQLSIGILTYFAETFGGLRPTEPSTGSGLAAWQLRRAREIMHSRLAGHVTIADIARECQLTPSYFARAFRISTGATPHRYLQELRVAEAKSYLLSSTLPLADVALICGFGDQSYFTRVFTRSTGDSPGAWRRASKK